jgi:hypothetical protein
MSVKVIEGFAEQFKRSNNLVDFRLVHYRLSPASWKVLGRGLGQSKTLRTFTAQATNLNNNQNIANFLFEFKENQVIQKLNLSDNDLRDSQGVLVCEFLKKVSEKRDDQLWKKNLRKQTVQD